MDSSEAPSTASILIVDDTVENLRLLATMLAKHGFEPRPVTRGSDALTAASLVPPDVILLDISMPEMDGFEVCRRLKEMEALRDTPIIFLTGHTDTAAKVRAFKAGGADYITKPFQMDEVLARVNVQLELRRSRADLQRSYDRLRTLERLRDDLVHMVVHDMRSPLTALSVLLDVVMSEVGGSLGPEAAEDLRVAIDSAARVSRMANDLLDISRMEEGKLPLDRRPHDLLAICRDVVGRVAASDRTRRIDVDDGEAVVTCDGAIIARVVENLVGNAVKHTPRGTGVRVVVEQRADRTRVAVHDQGPGVAPADRARIFDKFGAVASRQAGSYHSVGLGLAFCKLAVEAHGGTIGVEPGDPVGSVFWFELPAA